MFIVFTMKLVTSFRCCRILQSFQRRSILGFHLQRLYSSQQQFRVCVVGSGPAGFYTAQSLVKNNKNITVDILEKLPVPFGLVRYGVAPDHPEVKNVINQFTALAQGGRCQFFGNIDIGNDVTVSELLDMYSAVVLSYGAASDKKLNIPGENLKGVYSARNFVGWYNGLPQDMELNPNLDTETAMVIGQGNVALDVARILLTPIEILKKTDISYHAQEALSRSKVKRVYLVGRRGPLQVSFTIKELREMVKLPGTRPLLQTADFKGLDKVIPGLPRGKKRLIELLYKTANEEPRNADRIETTNREWGLKFLRSPLEIIADKSGGCVAGVRFAINHIQEKGGQEIALPSGEEEFIKCGIVLKSIGYKSVQLDPIIPFDTAQGVIKNDKGRVDKVRGLYCSGWVKRGPVGVILSSLNDSIETAKTIITDIEDGTLSEKTSETSLLDLLTSRGVKTVTFEDWLNIDREERLRGQSRDKPREKISDINEMLDVAFKDKKDT
ncbi:NADPH:adrenodoxin oxidoreductase, mitochondrial [Holothuria leucospilota]|uniref:NADPH:adrenodoxin oxidoreductase, mitochondrial n=1 Tax=Holothuria leucospilota TaxID=206669 RepID=A0A9Q1C2K0_HOLLE|nr:NADPH:adrenodoxin oxidoreductase, mitochondrial [Holothuria leucospilota]